LINLLSSRLIERPIKQVFDFISTPENDAQWQYGTLATARLPKDSGSLQTFFRSIGHLMGRRNLGTFEVTEYQPNKKYGFKSLTGPVHSKTSYSLESMDGWTQIQISICVSVLNFFQITDSLVELTLEKQLEQDISRLKEILEEKATGFRLQQNAVQHENEPDDPQRAMPVTCQDDHPGDQIKEEIS